jgi:hypothetical protein
LKRLWHPSYKCSGITYVGFMQMKSLENKSKPGLNIYLENSMENLHRKQGFQVSLFPKKKNTSYMNENLPIEVPGKHNTAHLLQYKEVLLAVC